MSLMELSSLPDLQQDIASWIGRAEGKTAYFDIPELEVSLGTTIGNIRGTNQDRMIVAAIPGRDQPSFLFALCDGLGGMVDGDVCSTLALSTLTMALLGSSNQPAAGRLFRAAIAANAVVREKYKENGGCTLSAILYSPNEDRVMFSIGDSRIYSYGTGLFAKLTNDDTVMEQLKGFNKSPEASPNSRFNNQLTQFIGSSLALDSSSLKALPFSEGVGYILSSDGLHSLNQGVLSELVGESPNCSHMVRRLISLCLWGKAKDNASIIAVPKNIAEKLYKFPNKKQLILWNPYGRADFFYPAGTQSLPPPSPAPKANQTELLSIPLSLESGGQSSKKGAHKSKKKSRGGNKTKPKIQITPGQ